MVFKIIAGIVGGYLAAWLGAVLIGIVLVSYRDTLDGVVRIIFFSIWIILLLISLRSPSARTAWRILVFVAAAFFMLFPVSWLLFSFIQVAKDPESVLVLGGTAWMIISLVIAWPLSLFLFFIGWIIGRPKRTTKEENNSYYLLDQ